MVLLLSCIFRIEEKMEEEEEEAWRTPPPKITLLNMKCSRFIWTGREDLFRQAENAKEEACSLVPVKCSWKGEGLGLKPFVQRRDVKWVSSTFC